MFAIITSVRPSSNVPIGAMRNDDDDDEILVRLNTHLDESSSLTLVRKAHVHVDLASGVDLAEMLLYIVLFYFLVPSLIQRIQL